MRQSRDDLEATVGEPGAVVSLGGGQPVEGATQPIVVVVLGEAGEALAIEDLCCGTPQEASILPFVQGELISVRRCQMWRSRKR